MPRRLTNDLLVALLLGLVLTGVVGWALPITQAAPLYDLHRALGVAVIVVLGWKQAIALPSLHRRWPRRGLWDRSVIYGSVAGIVLLVTLGLGFAWTLGLISFDLLWGYSPLNVHVILGICLVPFVGWHMLVRRRANMLSAPVASRRSLLRVGSLGLATLIGWQAIERFAPAVRLRSGSKHAASFSGNDFPTTIWLFDSVPSIDAGEWRLSTPSGELSLAELTARFPRHEAPAVLDCTGGWWSEQQWSGFGVLDVLRASGPVMAASEAIFTSVTGHRIVLPMSELDDAVLATHVGGEALSPGHGYPLRLVVPSRRGYHWVKWLRSVELS